MWWYFSRAFEKRKKSDCEKQRKKIPAEGKIQFFFFCASENDYERKFLSSQKQRKKAERDILWDSFNTGAVYFFCHRSFSLFLFAVVYWWVHFSFFSFYDSFRIFHNFSFHFSLVRDAHNEDSWTEHTLQSCLYFLFTYDVRRFAASFRS